MPEPQLDWLAGHVIEVLRERVDSEPYIAEKIDRLDGLDRFRVMVWAGGVLDETSFEMLADRLGVDEATLRLTCRTARDYLQP